MTHTPEADTIDARYKAMCLEHDLNCLSSLTYADGRTTVFPHWNDSYGNDRCVSGTGKTFDEAFAKAIANANAERAALEAL